MRTSYPLLFFSFLNSYDFHSSRVYIANIVSSFEDGEQKPLRMDSGKRRSSCNAWESESRAGLLVSNREERDLRSILPSVC